jgi:small GTP-binding protein
MLFEVQNTENSAIITGRFLMISGLVYKITLLGDGAVGKTSLRNRFMGQLFDDTYHMTIGTDFAAKMVEVDGQEIKFQIWDIAGHPFYESQKIVLRGIPWSANNV